MNISRLLPEWNEYIYWGLEKILVDVKIWKDKRKTATKFSLNIDEDERKVNEANREWEDGDR